MPEAGARSLVRAHAVAMLATLCVAGGASAAAAQVFPGDVAPLRPIRIEGQWERPRSDPAVIGEITISAERGERRPFGVTALQAYKPEEEGMPVLRHTALQPSTLLLRGHKDMVEKFVRAGRDDKIVAFGVYRPASAMFELSSVEVHAGGAPRGDAPHDARVRPDD
jgi:hypothetical protein